MEQAQAETQVEKVDQLCHKVLLTACQCAKDHIIVRIRKRGHTRVKSLNLPRS